MVSGANVQLLVIPPRAEHLQRLARLPAPFGLESAHQGLDLLTAGTARDECAIFSCNHDHVIKAQERDQPAPGVDEVAVAPDHKAVPQDRIAVGVGRAEAETASQLPTSDHW